MTNSLCVIPWCKCVCSNYSVLWNLDMSIICGIHIGTWYKPFSIVIYLYMHISYQRKQIVNSWVLGRVYPQFLAMCFALNGCLINPWWLEVYLVKDTLISLLDKELFAEIYSMIGKVLLSKGGTHIIHYFLHLW